jgi:hypothetical protein
MQNPMTPALPENPSCAVSHRRAASMSSKVLPLRSPMSRMTTRRHRSRLPQWYRSGATAMNPSPASQSAWARRSWLIPVKSCTTTTPGGHGGGVLGTAL